MLHRPETVGEGNHRFFMSDSFRNADPSLAERISKDLNAAAIQFAGRSFPEGRHQKRARTNTSCGNSAMAVEEVPSRAEMIPSGPEFFRPNISWHNWCIHSWPCSLPCICRRHRLTQTISAREECSRFVCRPPAVSQESLCLALYSETGILAMTPVISNSLHLL
jgi:hypothetical protein